MNFLFPAFLFGLFAIAIPIIIHLFNFRRYKMVYFSNVGFLKDIKKESKKKSRLKQLLILIARILTLVFLVFAFSQPYIPADKNRKKEVNQTIGVYIDNSFSMNALSEKGQLLEVARKKALEIALAYPSGTNFRIFTNDLKLKHQHTFTKDQFIQQVSEIQTSPNVVPVSSILNRFGVQNNADSQNENKSLYLISDFQQSITDIENFEEDHVYCYFMPLLGNQVSNLYIDTCWVEVPAHRLNQEENIYVTIKNSSNQDFQNLPLKLYLNDSLKSITNFSVKAQNEITSRLSYTNNSSGSQLGKIEITDYPFTHDNNWFISYFVKSNLKALAIYNNSDNSIEGLNYLEALFQEDQYIQLDKMDAKSLQISKLQEYNTIFLINPKEFASGFLSEIKKVVEKGSSVVLFPNFNSVKEESNAFLSLFGAGNIIGTDTTAQEISGIDFENNLFKDVFKQREENAILPKLPGHLKFRENIKTTESNLLWFQNGDKALSLLPYSEGKVWIFGFPLEKKNEAFAKDILFVPTIYNIVLNSLPKQQISYTIGKHTFFTSPEKENISLSSTLKMVNKNTGEEYIPQKNTFGRQTRIEFGDLISNDGHYLIQENNKVFSALAFNFDRTESDLRFFSESEISKKLESSNYFNAMVVKQVDKDFSEVLDEIQNGKQLWKWCILLALFFILAEILISRFMK